MCGCENKLVDGGMEKITCKNHETTEVERFNLYWL
jgi:hypothetical protein